MPKKLLALFVSFVMLFCFIGCSSKSTDEKQEKGMEKYPDIGEKINVTKLEESKEWIVEKEDIVSKFVVPQLNIQSEEAKKINKEIADACKDAEERGLEKLEYTFGKKDALLSVAITLKVFNAEEYFAYNISLNDGKVPANESIMKLFGMKPYQFRAICSEIIATEYSMQFHSYKDSFPDKYEEGLKKSTDVENLKDIIPYVNSEGGLNFISKAYVMMGGEWYINEKVKQRSLENETF